MFCVNENVNITKVITIVVKENFNNNIFLREDSMQSVNLNRFYHDKIFLKEYKSKTFPQTTPSLRH